jgi:hypothetical protein
VIDNSPLTRRRFLNSAGILGGMLATFPVWADGLAKLNLPGGPDERSFDHAVSAEGNDDSSAQSGTPSGDTFRSV